MRQTSPYSNPFCLDSKYYLRQMPLTIQKYLFVINVYLCLFPISTQFILLLFVINFCKSPFFFFFVKELDFFQIESSLNFAGELEYQ